MVWVSERAYVNNSGNIKPTEHMRGLGVACLFTLA